MPQEPNAPAPAPNTPNSPNARTLPTPTQRAAAVLNLYRSRTSAPTTTQRTYTVYLVALSALIIGGPAFSLTRNITQQWLAESTATTVQAVLLAALFAVPLLAFAVGKFAGPFTTNTFVMRVLTSSNIHPRTYLSRIAAPRIAVVALCTTALCSAILSAAFFYALGQNAPESAGFASALLTATATAVSAAGSWVLGQIADGSTRVLVGSLVVAAGIAAVALGATKAMPVAWLLAAAIAGLAARSCWRVRPPTLLAACSRATTARMFVATGTAHYALDLYGDAPRMARGSALLPTSRLRSSVGVTLVRLSRSRGDAAAMCAYTALGIGLLAWGNAISGPISATVLVVAGTFAMYAGLGSAKEFWRALREELALLPLYGGGKVGAVRRHVGGLAVVFGVWAVLMGVLAGPVVGLMIDSDGAGAAAGLAVQLFVTLAVAALTVYSRIRNATKGVPPAWLLRPLLTPFGDASGLMLAVWQAEGALSIGVAALVLLV